MSDNENNKKLPEMQYVQLGNTGLRISRICLGCMSYGTSKWSSWVKDEKESIEFIKEAYRLNINFFDTADTYSNGESERVLGKALREIGAPRSRVVIATKVFAPVYSDPSRPFNRDGLEKDPEMVNGYGLSRKHILDAVDASLERLGVDYIDLYQIHRLDTQTPMEEIMQALNDVVRSGKVRYIGASTMAAWQFQKLNSIAERNGWAKFVSMQNLYNLLYREEEREMVPYCADAGIGMIPWSPLAMGALTGKTRNTDRSNTRFSFSMFPSAQQESNNTIIDRVEEIAKRHNVTSAQVALAWEFTKPFVSAPIIGASRIEQLHDLVGSLDLNLTKEEVKYLEEPYTPRPTI
ncbi:NADP-dependent oxidoreductase domain-containing protein [Parasitella parasitica]|nr:NADP-dependent oxidoreductase domain-containing protein [Parasitella parasitica]